MPDFILITIGVVFLILPFQLMGMGVFKQWQLWLIWGVVPVLLFWGGFAYQHRTYQEYFVQSYKVDNIDCTVLHGNIINLNDRFNRSFSVGEKLRVKEHNAYSYGIWFTAETDILEIIHVDAENPQ